MYALKNRPTQLLTQTVSVFVFTGLLLFSSCKETFDSTIIDIEPSVELPKDGYEALSQTLQLVNNKIKSQRQAQDILMAKMAQINDPNIRQAYAIFTQSSLLKRLSISDARARTNGEVLNTSEINKELNSTNVSSNVRKKIFDLGKELEKIKDEALKSTIDANSEIKEEIANMEKEVNSDTSLKEEEKVMLLGITQVLKNNYQDIKNSAEQAVANGRTSCWLCWIVNAIVTVIVVAVVVAVVAIAALSALATADGGNGNDGNVIAIIGGVFGVVAGVYAVVTGNCFVVWDHGQTNPNSGQSLLGFIEINNC